MSTSATRKFLFFLVILSLLVVPYSLIAYFCYLGLCGGRPASLIAEKYTSFYGYFFWIYFLVVVVSLIISRIFKNRQRFISTFFLLIPLLCLIPFAYVEYNVWVIQHDFYEKAHFYNRAHAEDYSCAAGQFIRVVGKNYHLFDFDLSGESGSVTQYNNLNELKAALERKGMSLDKCKNQSGAML